MNIHCTHVEENRGNRKYFFGKGCNICRYFKSFADNSSIIFKGNKCQNTLIDNLIDSILGKIAISFRNYRLKLNLDKTIMFCTTSWQQLAGNRTETCKLNTRNNKGENIVLSSSAKLLGITFNTYMILISHFSIGEYALLQKLKKKKGALKYTSNKASINIKNKLVNLVIMSLIVYLITIWGWSAIPAVMNQVQVVQSIAMRWILRVNKYTSVHTLLNNCDIYFFSPGN